MNWPFKADGLVEKNIDKLLALDLVEDDPDSPQSPSTALLAWDEQGEQSIIQFHSDVWLLHSKLSKNTSSSLSTSKQAVAEYEKKLLIQSLEKCCRIRSEFHFATNLTVVKPIF